MTTEYRVRSAEPRDLPDLAAFEAQIARVSFGENAVDSLDVQEKKLRKAMQRDTEGMLVACGSDDRPIGWLWITLNTNPMTDERYANFRSLAVDEVPDRSDVGEELLEQGIRMAVGWGARSVVGRVHSRNLAMRMIYRKFGFEVSHLTMELDPSLLPAGDPAP